MASVRISTSYGQKNKHDGDTKEFQCRKCGRTQIHHRIRIKTDARIWGLIPVFSATQSRHIVCSKCGCTHEVTPEEYKLFSPKADVEDGIINGVLNRPSKLEDTITSEESFSEAIKRMTSGQYQKSRLCCWISFLTMIISWYCVFTFPSLFEEGLIGLLVVCLFSFSPIIWLVFVVVHSKYGDIKRRIKKRMKELHMARTEG